MRLAAARGNKIVFFRRRPSGSLSDMVRWLRRLWRARRWGVLDRLIVGSKGVWTRPERRSLATALNGLARTVSIFSDAELGLHAALGQEAGVFVTAGTGSIAVGRTAAGELQRSGGLGPGRGDEGSGWWIGREYLKRARPGSKFARPGSAKEVRRVAGMAARVLNGRGSLERRILGEAREHLVQLAAPLLTPGTRLALGGALFSHARFRRGFRRRMRALGPFDVRPFLADPVRRAARRPAQFPTALPASVPPRRGAKK